MTESFIRYQRDKNIKTKVVSIWLEEDTDASLVIRYCGQCRAPLFQYGGNEVMEVPGDSPSELPFYLQCRNKRCGIKYKIHGMLK